MPQIAGTDGLNKANHTLQSTVRSHRPDWLVAQKMEVFKYILSNKCARFLIAPVAESVFHQCCVRHIWSELLPGSATVYRRIVLLHLGHVRNFRSVSPGVSYCIVVALFTSCLLQTERAILVPHGLALHGTCRLDDQLPQSVQQKQVYSSGKILAPQHASPLAKPSIIT